MSEYLKQIHELTNAMLGKAKAGEWDAVLELEKERLLLFQALQDSEEKLTAEQKSLVDKIQQSSEIVKTLATTEKDELKSEIKLLVRKKNAKKEYK